MDSSQLIGLAILAAFFPLSKISWVSSAERLGSLSCWNVHRHFIFIIQAICFGTFCHSSFLQFYEICQYCILENNPTPWYSHFQTSVGMCVLEVMCNAICFPNMVCIMVSSKFNFGLLWPEYVLPRFYRLVQMLCSKLLLHSQTSNNPLALNFFFFLHCQNSQKSQ